MRNFTFTTLLVFTLLISKSIHAQYLISCSYISTTSSFTLSFPTGLTLDYDADLYKMVYNTIDVNGSPTIASGAFMVPANTTCIDFPMAVYQHGTSLNKSEVPSNDIQETFIGKIFAAGGYFVMMPDYLGMGDSPGLHPYVHGESEATAAIDMVRAAREYIADSLGMTDNGELFLTGYSQGGHACMAAHKYISDNNLQSEFNVVASAPCSGPYDLSGIMADTIMAPTPYSNPGYIVYLLASYEHVYGNIFNSWSDVLYSPYDTIVPPYFSGNNTTLGMGSLNNLLPNYMDSLIRDTCMSNFTNDSVNQNHPWWKALLDNDNYDWTPQEPVRMYYCTADEQVAYTNALTAEAAMNTNGAPSVEAINAGSGLTHGGCIFPALTSAFNWFQSLKTECNSLSISSLSIIRPKIYPNPTIDYVEIEIDEPAQINIYTSEGRLLLSTTISTKDQIKMVDWKKGIYLFEINSLNQCYKSYVIKQ